MKKNKIYYWSPFISKIATIKAVLNSNIALNKFSNRQIDAYVINSFGEFSENSYRYRGSYLKFKLLVKNNYIKFFSDKGFLKSRLSWILISLITVFPLIRLLKKEKPDYLIIHLLTFLPLLINRFFNLETKIILRISGLPKLNLFRMYLWKLCIPKIHSITCPTLATKKFILSLNLINPNKVYFLPDPVLEIQNIINKKTKYKETFGDYILAAGRLTKQKNFQFLIKFFYKISKEHPNLKLVIAGEGEKKNDLQNLTKKYNINQKVNFIGHTNDLYSLMKESFCFISTSLWEDPGFVIIEAVVNRANIISSNCKNGPEEILLDGEGGYLYSSNDMNDLLKKFYKFNKDYGLYPKILYKKKLLAMKNIKIYTKFNHYKIFSKILI